jgi:hypothetical protein
MVPVPFLLSVLRIFSNTLVARVLDEQFPEIKENSPEVLAPSVSYCNHKLKV